MSFERQLTIGRVGESLIARWLMSRGHTVLPVYEIEKNQGKGPQLFSANQSLVAPDMLVFTANGQQFIEAKHKSVFTWHRNTQQWTTGIDMRHYGDYLRVGKQTQLPVWLMFFHRESTPDARDIQAGCPPQCPTGLYGGDLFGLVIKENHRAKPFDAQREGYVGHGKSGMVYWAEPSLKKLASCEEVEFCEQVRKAA
jgi:hypothetical protein